MSAPLVVNTVDGTCWTRREAVRDGQALYAPEKCGGCPDFVMATYAELEEHGIAGEAYALPVPVGPQMPEFPPPPRTEVEKLCSDVARLQGLLAEAVQDAHQARRERDLMRERVSEPYGCQHCGIAKRVHGRRYLGGAGMHAWTAPSQEQIAERMRARRTVRLAEDAERLRSRVAGLEAERHVTNEALSDADVQLRADRDRIAALEAEAAAQRRTGYQVAINVMRQEKLPMSVELLEAQLELEKLDFSAPQERPAGAYPLALPWAKLMDAEDLHDFLDELAASAITHASDAVALTEVEATCGRWRMLAEAQHAHNTAPGPSAAESADKLTRFFAPTQALQEDPHDSPLHRSFRLGHDMPETGGAR